MSRAPLWRLPEEALYFDETAAAWQVMAARGLGESRAIFIPLVKPDGDWQVAIEDQVHLPFTRVMNSAWTTLPRRGGPRDCVYLCALRYDLPSNHPDDSFRRGPDGAPELASGEPPPAVVSGRELKDVLVRFKERNAERIELDVVDGPPDEEDPGEAAPAQAAARARSIAPAPAPAGPAPGGTPQPLPEELSFAFGSCQYPAGMLDRRAAHASYRALAGYLRQPGVRTPERLLLLGDQVYTDATYGLLDPARLDDRYRLPYEQLTCCDGPWARVPQDLKRVTCMTPDDHEIADDWEPWFPGATGEQYKRGMAAYWRYQRGEETPPDHLWTTQPEPWEPHEGWRLFMADTRTAREYRSEETLAEATILGRPQTDSLEAWLAEAPPEDLKIVSSAAMLLPRTRMFQDTPLRLDNWQGYPASFQRLLAFVCDRGLRNLVFLSGDLHLGCSARVRVRNRATGQEVEFQSHHAPALYAPYPFANETRWNLLLEDRFSFTREAGGQAGTYDVSVSGHTLGEGAHGCGILEARRNGAGWKLETSFLRA
jgi:cholesterol oxidase